MVRKYAMTEDEFLSGRVDPVDGHLKFTRDNGDTVDMGVALGPAVTDEQVAARVADPASATSAELVTKIGDAVLPRAKKNALTGWFHVDGYGAAGDGVAYDDAAINACIAAAVADGGTIYFPDGIYRVSTSPTITGQDITVRFGASAWIYPDAGVGLTILNSSRVTLEGPKIRFNGGTPEAGIVVSNSTRTIVNEPVLWSYGTISGVLDGIVVEDNSYWAEIHGLRSRKESSGLTGSFRRIVSFLGISNAGVVSGGNFAFGATGVYIEDSNSVLVHGSAFEVVTDGIEIAGAGQGGAGTRVIDTRHEQGTNCINISTAVTANNSPLFFSGVSRIASVTNLVTNPNGVAYTMLNGAQFVLRASGYGDAASAGIDVYPLNQPRPPFRILTASGTRKLELSKWGDLILNSDSAAWPSDAAHVGVCRFYSTTTYLGSVHPSSTTGEVAVGVGNGTGGFQKVLSVIGTAARPGTDNTYDLGAPTLQWRHGYFAGVVRTGAVATTARPSASTMGAGAMIFDSTLKKPIWSTGTAWVDAAGATV